MEPYGARGKIGILVPAFNTVVQPDTEALRPEGVTNHIGRFVFDANVIDNAKAEAEKIVLADVDVVLIALSPDGIPGGLELLAGVAEEVEQSIGRPVISASHATHAGLRKMGASRIGLVTPFENEENANVRSAFAAAGFEVMADRALARPIEKIGETPPSAVRAAFDEVAGAGVEALALVGTGLPALGILEETERELGLPLVACNVAGYWQALRRLGLSDPVEGAGRLLREY